MLEIGKVIEANDVPSGKGSGADPYPDSPVGLGW
jgi:hypothetical protein